MEPTTTKLKQEKHNTKAGVRVAHIDALQVFWLTFGLLADLSVRGSVGYTILYCSWLHPKVQYIFTHTYIRTTWKDIALSPISLRCFLL